MYLRRTIFEPKLLLFLLVDNKSLKVYLYNRIK